jgi:hypothetical protein
MYPGVEKVEPIPEYKLMLTFDNGEVKVFDMNPYLRKGTFRELKDLKVFSTVKVSFDTIEWTNGVDLCPEVLYENSV